MSAATDFLREWIGKAADRAPSITRTNIQRSAAVGTPPNFKPGIVAYGWGIDGQIVKDAAGNNNGLTFPSISVWFSDRGLDLSNPPPDSGQQFAGNRSDQEQMTLTVAGDEVALQVHLETWKTQFTVNTNVVDGPSQQLLFSDAPPVGPEPVRSLLVISFADTGSFAWL